MIALALNKAVTEGLVFFSFLTISLVIFLTVRAYRKKISVGLESMIGETARVVEWTGKKGRIRIQGEVWHAVADETLTLKKNDKVFVKSLDGLNIKIRAIE